MNVLEIPNELLLQIFESLAFKDAIECSLVCRRFKSIIAPNFSKFYIDSWPASKVPNRGYTRSHQQQQIASSNSIMSIDHGYFNLFAYVPFSKRFFRTATSRILAAESVIGFDFIPQTSNFMYCTSDSIVVYDLKNDREIARKRHLLWKFVGCVANYVLVEDRRKEIVVYSWDGSELTFLKSLGDLSTAVFALCGTLSIQRENSTRIDFIDFTSIPRITGQNLTSIDTVTGPDFLGPMSMTLETDERLLGISSDGQVVVTKRDHHTSPMEIVFYDRKTSQILLKFMFSSCCNFYLADSVDSRFLLLKSFYEILIVDLKLKRKCSITKRSCTVNFCCIRLINGQYYIQMLCWYRVRLRKIDEKSGVWHSVA